jgi:hypothetical protein
MICAFETHHLIVAIVAPQHIEPRGSEDNLVVIVADPLDSSDAVEFLVVVLMRVIGGDRAVFQERPRLSLFLVKENDFLVGLGLGVDVFVLLYDEGDGGERAGFTGVLRSAL